MAFSTRNGSFLGIILPLLLLVSAGAGVRHADADAHRVESLTIQVIGMSFIDPRYQTQAEIARTGEGYTAKYWHQEGRLRFGRRDLSTASPDCVRTVEAGNELLRAFVARIEGLQDGGEAAKCCEHPWTEISLHYRSSPPVEITVGEDILRREYLASVAGPARKHDD